MSKQNINKKETVAPTKKSNKKLWISIAIGVVVIAIIATVAVILVNQDKNETDLPKEAFDEDGRFNYMHSDMSEYVTVDEVLYKNTTVTLPTYLNGSDEAVNEYIQLLLKTYAVSTDNKITDQPIKEGDKVAIYYEGWLDGEKFDGGSNMSDASPYVLEIGSGTFIPGFEEGLIGLVPNTTSKEAPFDLHVTFPKSYHSADLAGKAVIFKVYVVYIQEMVPAEYTEDFITKTVGYTTTETDVKAAFEKHLKEEYLPEMKETEIANAIWANLMDGVTVNEYPKGEIDYFYNSYLSQYQQYYQYYSSMFPSFDAFMAAYIGANWKTDIEEQCEFDVKQNLIFHRIVQDENMIITDTDYQNALQYYVDYYAEQGQKNAQGNPLSASEIEAELGERMIKEQALWDKVNALIVENCTVVYE